MLKLVAWPVKIIDEVSHMAFLLAMVALVTMASLVVIAVIMRYALNIPLHWSDEIIGYLNVIVITMTIGLVTRREEHLTVTLVFDKLSEVRKSAARCLFSTGALIFLSVVCWQGYRLVAYTFIFDERSMSLMRFPVTYPYALFAIAMTIGFLQFVIMFVANARDLSKAILKRS